MHTEDTNDEAHGLDAFLPWHRAYLLDLERELQLIDPAVALPYWRFDEPAPRLFSPDFMGAPAGADPRSSAGRHPRCRPPTRCASWTIDGAPWVDRHPRFADPRVSAASSQPGRTVARRAHAAAVRGPGGPRRTRYEDVFPSRSASPGFRDILEGNPHGAAHVSFSGYIRSPGTAAGDPLFFLLHCNVDRIWAQWQWHEERFDGEAVEHVLLPRPLRRPRARPGSATTCTTRCGRGTARPAACGRSTAPRQPLLASAVVAGPPPVPTVGDLIDFQGQSRGRPPCGFDYDDVPFEKRPQP